MLCFTHSSQLLKSLIDISVFRLRTPFMQFELPAIYLSNSADLSMLGLGAKTNLVTAVMSWTNWTKTRKNRYSSRSVNYFKGAAYPCVIEIVVSLNSMFGI